MATVGKTTTGTIDYGESPGWLRGARITMPEDGQITKITAYVLMWPGGTAAKFAIYDAATGAKLAESTPAVPPTSKAWIDFPISCLGRAGQVLYFLILSDGTTYMDGAPGPVGGGSDVVLYGQTYPTFPATITRWDAVDDSELSIYATYTPTVAPPQYQLTIQATAGGTTNPAPAVYGPYPSGSLETVMAVQAPGYTFDHWTLDGANAGSASPTNVVMNMNHTLVAVFVTLPTVTYTLMENSTPIQGVPFTKEKVA